LTLSRISSLKDLDKFKNHETFECLADIFSIKLMLAQDFQALESIQWALKLPSIPSILDKKPYAFV